MKTSPLKTGLSLAGKLILLLLSVSAVLCVVEVAARWQFSEKKHEKWERAERLMADLPEKEAFQQDLQQAWPDGEWSYHPYYLYGLRETQTATFTVGPAFSARPCVDSSPEAVAQERIWFFGGSTMEDRWAPDARTLANQVILGLKSGGLSCFGVNYGTRSFQSSLELIKFQDLLRRLPKSRHPSIAVFYDGHNDAAHAYRAGAGNAQYDIHVKERMLVEQDHWGLLRYSVAELLGKYSVFCRRFICPRLMPIELQKKSPVNLTAENLDQAVKIYLDNVRMSRRICKEFGITPLYILQPLVVTKQGLGAIDREAREQVPKDRQQFILDYYQRIQKELGGQVDFLDLTGVLDHNGRSDFYDVCHTGPFTQAQIGAAIAQHLLKSRGSDDK